MKAGEVRMLGVSMLKVRFQLPNFSPVEVSTLVVNADRVDRRIGGTERLDYWRVAMCLV